MKTGDLQSIRILQLNKFLVEGYSEPTDVNEGIGSTIKNIKRKISNKREVNSLISTHKQGLKNVKWAQDNGYMDPKVNPGRHTYQKAKKSSELRDVYNHMHGKKRTNVKRVVGNR